MPCTQQRLDNKKVYAKWQKYEICVWIEWNIGLTHSYIVRSSHSLLAQNDADRRSSHFSNNKNVFCAQYIHVICIFTSRSDHRSQTEWISVVIDTMEYGEWFQQGRKSKSPTSGNKNVYNSHTHAHTRLIYTHFVIDFSFRQHQHLAFTDRNDYKIDLHEFSLYLSVFHSQSAFLSCPARSHQNGPDPHAFSFIRLCHLSQFGIEKRFILMHRCAYHTVALNVCLGNAHEYRLRKPETNNRRDKHNIVDRTHHSRIKTIKLCVCARACMCVCVCVCATMCTYNYFL